MHSYRRMLVSGLQCFLVSFHCWKAWGSGGTRYSWHCLPSFYTPKRVCSVDFCNPWVLKLYASKRNIKYIIPCKKKTNLLCSFIIFFLIVFIFLPVLWKINKDQRGKCCNANFQNSLHYRFNNVQLLFNPASGFQKAIKPWLGKLNDSTKDESQMISTKRLFECF